MGCYTEPLCGSLVMSVLLCLPGGVLESCSQHRLGCAAAASHHRPVRAARQIQPLPPHPVDLRSAHSQPWLYSPVFTSWVQFSKVCVCCGFSIECLSLLASASAMFSFILLFGVVVVVGLFNLEYYTGRWMVAGLFWSLSTWCFL